MYTIGDLVAYDGLVFRVTAVSEDETPTYTLEPIRRKETTLTKTVSYPRKIMTLVIGEGTPLTSVSADDMTPLGAVTAQAVAIKDGYVRVKFVTGEGTAIDSQVIVEDAKVVAPVDPAREGYTFGGWYSDAECISALNLTSATFGEDSSVYAKWTINTFTVTFNSNGGSVVSTQTINWSDVAEKPTAPTKASYLFDAWYSDSELSEEFDFKTPITENITLYAGWDDAVIVTFNSNEGSPVDAQTILVGALATKPVDPTREGHVFAGWYYDDDTFDDDVNFETDVFSEDDILHAKWIETVTVTFDSKGGSAVDAQVIPTGGLATKPLDPILVGNTFGGWFYSDDGSFLQPVGFDTDVFSVDTTVYAKWTLGD